MIRRAIEDIVMAFAFMTRLPVGKHSVAENRRPADAFWAMPLAGLVVGAGAGAIMAATLLAGLGAWVAAAACLAATALATGALHDDGLADLCDGLGGGGTAERRLEIMKDPHIGVFGMVGLILVYLMTFSTLAELAERTTALQLLLVVGICAMLARAAIALPFMLLKPARSDGLADYFGRPSALGMAIGIAWPVAIAVVGLGTVAFAVIAAMATTTVVVTMLARRHLGGYTGDVFGAVIALTYAGGLLGARMMM